MDTRTVETYNKAARAYAEKFARIGSRADDIERTFAAWGGEKDPSVLELGCGDGRDALEICKRTKKYIGIDASKEMIAIAREEVPPRSIFSRRYRSVSFF